MMRLIKFKSGKPAKFPNFAKGETKESYEPKINCLNYQVLSYAWKLHNLHYHNKPWVLATYGDAAKTKTITTKKYARIVALLKSLTCGNSSLAPVLDKAGNLVPQVIHK